MNLAQLRRLVGNPDAYALQREDGTWEPKRYPLTDAVLKDHLERAITVGTYVGHRIEDEGARVPERDGNAWTTVSRTLVLDFDTDDMARSDAQRAKDALVSMGLSTHQVGIEFSGRKGYHVWVVLADWRPNSELRRVGRAALALADLSQRTEVFPKQDEVRDLGNLVKLPGGVHRVTGKPNDFVTYVPAPTPVALWQRILAKLPEEVRASTGVTAENRFPCLGIIQAGVSESRNIQLFHLATMFRRNGAEEDLVRAILEHVNGLGDPLDDTELEGIVRGSASSGPICQQLPGDVEDACGECCIRTRTSGLYSRPGQLRHAAEGESVVVTIDKRIERLVKFSHQDLETGSAQGRMKDGR